MLKISISGNMESKIKELSAKKRISQDSIITNALKYYLPIMEEGLEGEFEIWDALSDEALISFENKLET